MVSIYGPPPFLWPQSYLRTLFSGILPYGQGRRILSVATSLDVHSELSGMDSLRAYDNLVYSASVVLSAISVCSCDFDTIGKPAYIIT